MLTGRQRDELPFAFLEQLEEEVGADFVVELIQTFLDDIAAKIDALCDACHRGNLETASGLLHTIKSSLRQLEVVEMALTCEQIETLAQKQDFRGLQLLIDHLQEQFKWLRQELGEYINRVSPVVRRAARRSRLTPCPPR